MANPNLLPDVPVIPPEAGYKTTKCSVLFLGMNFAEQRRLIERSGFVQNGALKIYDTEEKTIYHYSPIEFWGNKSIVGTEHYLFRNYNVFVAFLDESNRKEFIQTFDDANFATSYWHKPLVACHVHQNGEQECSFVAYNEAQKAKEKPTPMRSNHIVDLIINDTMSLRRALLHVAKATTQQLKKH